MPSDIESLQQTNGSHHGETFSFCKLAGLVIVQEHCIGPALFRQKNRTQLSRTKGILIEGHGQG